MVETAKKGPTLRGFRADRQAPGRREGQILAGIRTPCGTVGGPAMRPVAWHIYDTLAPATAEDLEGSKRAVGV